MYRSECLPSRTSMVSVTGTGPGKNSVKDNCVVCKTRIPFPRSHLAASREVICSAPECLKIWETKAVSRLDQFDWKVKQRRRFLADQRLNKERQEQLLREKTVNEEKENRHIELRLLATNPVYSQNVKSLPTVSLPSGRGETTRLSDKRKSEYQAFLHDLISRGFADSSGSTTMPSQAVFPAPMTRRVKDHPEIDKMNTGFCTTCSGWCCTYGRNAAHLNDASIKRIRFENPAILPLELMDIYMSALQSETIDQSCINHTPKGCGLDRKYRSNTCNTFYCEPMKEFADLYAAEPGEISGALVINRKQGANQAGNCVVKTFIVEPGQVKDVDPDTED